MTGLMTLVKGIILIVNKYDHFSIRCEGRCEGLCGPSLEATRGVEAEEEVVFVKRRRRRSGGAGLSFSPP